VALTRVSPSLFATSNNITSVTVGGSANTISLTFDGSGVITSATNNAVSVANTAITGNIISSQITSVANTQITGNITAAQITSVANTQITGTISVANTAITGNIISSQITPNPTLYGNVSVTGVIGVGGATPSTSGSGITFPASQSASSNANTLDDYEEGTYTPSIQNFTVSGTTTLTGSYTRIGNLVSFNVTFVNTGTIAFSTSALITTPFTSGLINSGAINMWINSNGYAFNSNQSGTQLNTGETNFDRFFVGQFTTTSAGQQLLFAGTYRITP